LFNWVTTDSALLLLWLYGITMSPTCLVQHTMVLSPKLCSSRQQKDVCC
jgi:hypothetical protein